MFGELDQMNDRGRVETVDRRESCGIQSDEDLVVKLSHFPRSDGCMG